MSGLYLHDPLAVAAALDPSLLTTAPRRVVVDLEGETRGQTRATSGGGVAVAQTVRAAEFVQRFGDRLDLPNADLQGALRESE